MLTLCELCDEPIVADRPGTYQYASGWLPTRAAGGANTIACAEREPRYACSVCIDRLRHGISPTQGSLL